jgi:hypothetical protein
VDAFQRITATAVHLNGDQAIKTMFMKKSPLLATGVTIFTGQIASTHDIGRVLSEESIDGLKSEALAFFS